MTTALEFTAGRHGIPVVLLYEKNPNRTIWHTTRQAWSLCGISWSTHLLNRTEVICDCKRERDMGAIVDILLLSRDDISLLKKKYPSCALINLTNSVQVTQRYRLILPTVEQDDISYYSFLLDNLIAMSSANFLARIESDEDFSKKMRARFASNLRKFMDLSKLE